MGLNVQALADFSNQTAGEIVPKLIYGGQSVSVFPVTEGVKFSQPLNIFDVDLVIQSGSCVGGDSTAGSLIATQRNIQVDPRTSYDSLCLKDMDPKYLGVSSLSAGSYNETFTLAQTYADLLVSNFNKKNDERIWSATGTGTDAASVGGLRYLTTSSINTDVVVAGTGSFDSTTALDVIDEMIAALPSDVQDRTDLSVWMSVANFRKYTAALRKANNFYFDPASIENTDGMLSMAFPFNNVVVRGTSGLQGSERIVLMADAHVAIGTDLLSDFTEFQMWYDIAKDALSHRISSKLGVQVAFPQYIVSNDKA